MRTEREKMLAGELYDALDPDPPQTERAEHLQSVADAHARPYCHANKPSPVSTSSK
jgi:hypothetical protein